MLLFAMFMLLVLAACICVFVGSTIILILCKVLQVTLWICIKVLELFEKDPEPDSGVPAQEVYRDAGPLTFVRNKRGVYELG